MYMEGSFMCMDQEESDAWVSEIYAVMDDCQVCV